MAAPTAVALPEPPPAVSAANYYARIHAALLAHPALDVLTWPGATPAESPARYSAAEVLAQVSRARRYLRAQGVVPGQRILVAVPVGPALVAALLALLALGAVAVLPPAGMSWLTRLRLPGQAGATAAVVVARPRLTRRWLARRLGLRLLTVPADTPPHPHPAAEFVAFIAPAWTPAPVAPDQPALVSHSSGSTSGRPKPIVRTHAVLAAQHAALRAAHSGRGPASATFRFSPTFCCIVWRCPRACAAFCRPCRGATCPAWTPRGWRRSCVAEGVETLTGNVTYFRRMLPALTGAARPARWRGCAPWAWAARRCPKTVAQAAAHGRSARRMSSSFTARRRRNPSRCGA